VPVARPQGVEPVEHDDLDVVVRLFDHDVDQARGGGFKRDISTLKF
jgi:hypothetical protein